MGENADPLGHAVTPKINVYPNPAIVNLLRLFVDAADDRVYQLIHPLIYFQTEKRGAIQLSQTGRLKTPASATPTFPSNFHPI